MALDAQLGVDFAWCSVAIIGFWGICYVISGMVTIHSAKDKSVVTNPTLAQRFEVADTIFALPMYVLLFACALRGSIDMNGDVNSRWYGVTFSSWLGNLVYLARMLTHCAIQWVVLASNPTLRLQMTAHHVLSIFAACWCLTTNRMQFWTCLCGCCEFSTIFLNFIYVYKFLAPERQDSIFAKLSGLFLWIGFVVFRLALFPYWLYMFYTDITVHAVDSWDRVTLVERYFYPFLTIVLLVLSCIWFVPITKGLLKAMGLSGKKEKNPTKQN